MRIDIETVGFEPEQDLLDYVDEKIKKLSRFFENITGIDVYLKSIHDDNAQTKVAEIKVFLPGPSIYAEYQTDTFYGAIDQVTEKVKKQLKKRNELMKMKRQ